MPDPKKVALVTAAGALITWVIVKRPYPFTFGHRTKS